MGTLFHLSIRRGKSFVNDIPQRGLSVRCFSFGRPEAMVLKLCRSSVCKKFGPTPSLRRSSLWSGKSLFVAWCIYSGRTWCVRWRDRWCCSMGGLSRTSDSRSCSRQFADKVCKACATMPAPLLSGNMISRVRS